MLCYDTVFTSIAENKQGELLQSKSEDCNTRHLVDKALNVFMSVHLQIAILLTSTMRATSKSAQRAQPRDAEQPES